LIKRGGMSAGDWGKKVVNPPALTGTDTAQGLRFGEKRGKKKKQHKNILFLLKGQVQLPGMGGEREKNLNTRQAGN